MNENNVFNVVPTFNWNELDGKQLTICVREDEGYIVVSGLDAKGHIYVLHVSEVTTTE